MEADISPSNRTHRSAPHVPVSPQIVKISTLLSSAKSATKENVDVLDQIAEYKCKHEVNSIEINVNIGANDGVIMPQKMTGFDEEFRLNRRSLHRILKRKSTPTKHRSIPAKTQEIGVDFPHSYVHHDGGMPIGKGDEHHYYYHHYYHKDHPSRVLIATNTGNRHRNHHDNCYNYHNSSYSNDSSDDIYAVDGSVSHYGDNIFDENDLITKDVDVVDGIDMFDIIDKRKGKLSDHNLISREIHYESIVNNNDIDDVIVDDDDVCSLDSLDDSECYHVNDDKDDEHDAGCDGLAILGIDRIDTIDEINRIDDDAVSVDSLLESVDDDDAAADDIGRNIDSIVISEPVSILTNLLRIDSSASNESCLPLRVEMIDNNQDIEAKLEIKPQVAIEIDSNIVISAADCDRKEFSTPDCIIETKLEIKPQDAIEIDSNIVISAADCDRKEFSTPDCIVPLQLMSTDFGELNSENSVAILSSDVASINVHSFLESGDHGDQSQGIQEISVARTSSISSTNSNGTIAPSVSIESAQLETCKSSGTQVTGVDIDTDLGSRVSYSDGNIMNATDYEVDFDYQRTVHRSIPAGEANLFNPMVLSTTDLESDCESNVSASDILGQIFADLESVRQSLCSSFLKSDDDYGQACPESLQVVEMDESRTPRESSLLPAGQSYKILPQNSTYLSHSSSIEAINSPSNLSERTRDFDTKLTRIESINSTPIDTFVPTPNCSHSQSRVNVDPASAIVKSDEGKASDLVQTIELIIGGFPTRLETSDTTATSPLITVRISQHPVSSTRPPSTVLGSSSRVELNNSINSSVSPDLNRTSSDSSHSESLAASASIQKQFPRESFLTVEPLLPSPNQWNSPNTAMNLSTLSRTDVDYSEEEYSSELGTKSTVVPTIEADSQSMVPVLSTISTVCLHEGIENVTNPVAESIIPQRLETNPTMEFAGAESSPDVPQPACDGHSVEIVNNTSSSVLHVLVPSVPSESILSQSICIVPDLADDVPLKRSMVEDSCELNVLTGVHAEDHSELNTHLKSLSMVSTSDRIAVTVATEDSVSANLGTQSETSSAFVESTKARFMTVEPLLNETNFVESDRLPLTNSPTIEEGMESNNQTRIDPYSAPLEPIITLDCFDSASLREPISRSSNNTLTDYVESFADRVMVEIDNILTPPPSKFSSPFSGQQSPSLHWRLSPASYSSLSPKLRAGYVESRSLLFPILSDNTSPIDNEPMSTQDTTCLGICEGTHDKPPSISENFSSHNVTNIDKPQSIVAQEPCDNNHHYQSNEEVTFIPRELQSLAAPRIVGINPTSLSKISGSSRPYERLASNLLKETGK